MNSTLKALSALLCCLALPALAYNHEEVVGPLPAGKYAVACSNVEIDTARLAQLGGNAADYYEGHTVNGQTRYITDILAHPESAFRFQDRVPAEPLLYPTLFLQRPDFVALVCHPTSRDNTDANYRLPDDGGLVPHMQPAGQPHRPFAPREIAAQHHEPAYVLGADPPWCCSSPEHSRRFFLHAPAHLQGDGKTPDANGIVPSRPDSFGHGSQG